MKKTLAAYFSASGTTRKVAEMIAEAGDCALYEITPKELYTNDDLNWMNKKSRSSMEMSDKKIRPQITDTDAHIEEYDTIILGFPIWWYTAPTIIHTFLKSYDFSGKTVIPFATSGGSGMGKTDRVLKAQCPDTVQWRPGRLLNGRLEGKALREWVDSLNL